MAKKIIMPKLDMTMEEGEISSWFVKEGETVKKGDPLFEVLSEKAAIEVESTAKGTVLKILYGEGDVVPVAAAVAIVGKEGEDYQSLLETAEPGGSTVEEAAGQVADQASEEVKNGLDKPEHIPGDKVPATPAAKTLAAASDVALESVKPNEQGVVRKQQVEVYLSENQNTDSRKMTPLAKKIAEEHDIDVDMIQSEKHRIYSDDLTPLIAKQQDDGTGNKLKGIRKISAKRLTEVWQQVPMVTSTIEVDVSGVMALCDRINNKLSEDDVKINITDVLIKIMALALVKNPQANVSLVGDMLYEHKTSNISVAVSIEDGLTVPVIKDADKKGLLEINQEKRALARKAKEGLLSPEDLKGGCMTISNIGMFGVDIFTPLINMPESSILGIGRIAKKPVVVDDEIVIRPMMWLSHTFDHRALDGVPAMKLLGTIRDMIEDPDMLIL